MKEYTVPPMEATPNWWLKRVAQHLAQRHLLRKLQRIEVDALLLRRATQLSFAEAKPLTVDGVLYDPPELLQRLREAGAKEA